MYVVMIGLRSKIALWGQYIDDSILMRVQNKVEAGYKTTYTFENSQSLGEEINSERAT